MTPLPSPPSPTVTAIYAAYEADAETGYRAHLGASLIGTECPRAIWYGFRWATRAQHTGRILRLFQTGHLAEPRFVADLRRIGATVRNLVILNEDGSIADTIMINGVLQGDPGRLIKMVTLSFLADGRDDYPFPAYIVAGSRTDLLNNAALSDGVATFAAKGSEQDAFAEYIAAVHGTAATAYDTLDVAASGDLRIQNLAVREDTTTIEYAQVFRDGLFRLEQFDRYTGPVSYLQFETRGTDAGEVMALRDTNDFVNLLGGDDAANGGAGNDVLDGGTGSNFMTGGTGADVFFLDIRNPGGAPTWSTITDFTAEDELAIFGWNPAASRSFWVASDGAAGCKGATLHMDIDGDRDIDASVTFAGLTQAQAGTPFQSDGLLWFV